MSVLSMLMSSSGASRTPVGGAWTSRTSPGVSAHYLIPVATSLLTVAQNSGSSSIRLSTNGGITWSTPTRSGESYYGFSQGVGMQVLNAGGTLVALGSAGVAAISSDSGVTWTIKTPPVVLSYIIYHPTAGLLGFTSSKTLYISNNLGTTWTLNSAYGTAIGSKAFSMACINGSTVVVITTTGTILTSGNGTAWSANSSLAGFFDTNSATKIFFNNGVYYATGWKAPNYGLMYRSTNLTSWTSIDAKLSGRSIEGLAFAGGSTLFAVASGPMLSISTDNGVTWTARSYPYTGDSANGSAHMYNGKLYVLGKGANVLSSVDGVTWNYHPNINVNTSSIWLPMIQIGTDTFLLTYQNVFMRITNLETASFTKSNDLLRPNLYSNGRSLSHMASNPSGTVVLIAAYNSGIYRSTDGGVSFTYSNSLSQLYTPDVTTTPWIGWVNGQFVWYDSMAVYTSPDGLTWTFKATVGYGYTYIYRHLNEIIYANGTYFLVSTNTAYTSTDLVTWTESRTLRNTPGWSASKQGIAYGSGKYVVTNGSSKLAYSTDFLTWTVVDLSSFSVNTVGALFYDGEQFILVGGNSSIFLTSFDGVNWTSRTAELGAAYGSFEVYSCAKIGLKHYVAGSSMAATTI